MSIANNVAVIKENIRKAAIAAGRDPADIKLCAATKMNDADAVRQAIAAGVDLCGENRVQALIRCVCVCQWSASVVRSRQA